MISGRAVLPGKYKRAKSALDRIILIKYGSCLFKEKSPGEISNFNRRNHHTKPGTL